MTSFVEHAASPSDSGSPAPSSRKRPRSDASTEERKEARAHRNRIAAQNSRDRRKAQFAYLERRVAELEDENRALRAARGIPLLPVSAFSDARDRENEELRERIKTLERGWDAVLKALAAQGLPLAPPVTTPPISPAPSHSSLDTESSPPTPHDTGGDHRFPTDGPAAGGLAALDLDLLFPHAPPTTNEPDDATMENLFMEILASPLPAPATPSPAAATATRSAAQTAGSVEAPAEAGVSAKEVASSSSAVMGIPADLGIGADGGDVGGEGTAVVDLGLTTTDEHGWDSGLELQRILASLGVVGSGEESQGPTELELELGWPTYGAEGTGVGVF
ncbi:hypothetical protein C0995_009872 [Termitomyces sp. Mi166|nr:hypothetical protein C0995_009872 [Termitomyces sp. Mi166\